ncbi:MAG: DUF1549 domain-containing protein [Verrucomicrobiales bacterium]|nr:DUF1549 domain-containing protein [Verrucomicrobiales bacterium]
MNRFAAIAFSLFFPLLLSAGQPDASRQIDVLLEKKRAEAEIEPNPPISDETFVRRIYLDVAGRIPTIDEAHAFLDSTDPEKRENLIDTLLASEAAVSHTFNFWADILRMREYEGNNRLQTYAYQFWLKDALRRNVPYDDLIRQLITSRGWIWENGATAYYHRDRGMPLDNMSNTIRIFLGTRLECAQCHDHPFDQWTQMDYYQMAAFSYSMDARLWAPTGRKAVEEFRTEFMEEAKKRSPDGTVKPGTEDYLRYRAINQANADLFAFMKFVLARETPQPVKLPHDYQYDDAKPHDEVSPVTMFGEKIDPENVDNLVDAYADWMTSPENPRFTKVITNRLWKRAMGRGLLPSVDEITEQTTSENPELLAFLENRMIELDYDMRAFLREIYNTETYQRELSRGDVPLGLPYHFPGPAMRRLTAEQIWDSFVTLAIPDSDYYMPILGIRVQQLDRLREIHESLHTRTDEELVALVKEATDFYTENYLRVEELAAAHRGALAEKDEEKAATIGKELNGLRNGQRGYIDKMAHGKPIGGSGKSPVVRANFGIGSPALPQEKIKTTQPRPKHRPGSDKEFAAWREVSRDFMRASESPFPAPRGHFLREFGQSDREVIENASHDASVPQALELLNGPIVDSLANPNSVLRQALENSESPDEKIETLFLAVFSRRPTERERNTFEGEPVENVVWVLLNSQQFRFLN